MTRLEVESWWSGNLDSSLPSPSAESPLDVLHYMHEKRQESSQAELSLSCWLRISKRVPSASCQDATNHHSIIPHGAIFK